MANPGTEVLTDFNAALSIFFDEKVSRQFNRMAVTAELLEKVPGAGQAINWDVRVNRATHATFFTEGSDVAAGEYNIDPNLKATLGWGMYRSAFALSGLSVAAARTSPGSAIEMLNQFETNLVDAASDLVSQVNSELWLGTGATSRIAGFTGGGALSATGTYAGLNRATYPDFAGNLAANGGIARTLTKGLLDAMDASIFRASGQTARCIVTTPESATKYEALFDQVGRVQVDRGDISAISKTPNVGAPWIPSNSGYTGMSYKGIPVFRDRNVPAGTMAFINPDHVKLRVLPQVDLRTSPLWEMIQGEASNGDMPSNPMLSCKVESLAKTGDADKFQVVLYCQLEVKRPNACGIIQDISEV